MKNIHQLKPISIDINSDDKYLLSIQPGNQNDEKPFLLHIARIDYNSTANSAEGSK